MKEYQLNKEESKTVMDMVQDTFDRGMIASDYETEKLEEIIEETTTQFGDFKNDVEFEVVIRIKNK